MNTKIVSEDKTGFWWASEANGGGNRRHLYYDNNLATGTLGTRYYGIYVRCVVKKNTKTLSNLTYMQDMASLLWTIVNGRSYNEV